MATRGSRAEKVKRIFEQFDMNKDGGLNREELSSLVVAVNPAVKFSDEHFNAILDELVNGGGDEKGLTYDGLLQIYDDGAGDVDRDFDALGLELNNNHPLLLQQEIIPEQVSEPTHHHIISIINNSDDDEETDHTELLCTAHGDDNPKSFSRLLAGSELLVPGLIDAGFYDIVLSVLQRFPNLASEGNYMVNQKALQKMSERPFAFLSGSRLSFWQRVIYSVIHVDFASKPLATMKGDIEDPPNSSRNLSARPSYFSRLLTKLLSMTYLTQAPCIKRIYNQKLMHKEAAAFVKAMINFPECQEYLESSEVLKLATIFGTVELVEECFQAFPPLLSRNVNVGELLLHIAIKERNEKIFKIIRDNNERWLLDRGVSCGIVGENKTILHLVAKLAPFRQLNLISGAALQMQKEMQWFKEK